MNASSSPTCIGCKHATPSELQGMLWCVENRATTMRQFGYRVTSFGPNRAACGHHVARQEPLVLTDRLVPAAAATPVPTPNEAESFDLFSTPMAAPAPARAAPRAPVPPARQSKDDFSKEYFL